MSRRRTILAALGALAVALVAHSQAHAQTVTLRVADSLPVGHYAVEQGLKPWMDEVTKASGGAVAFQHFPAEQLGKAKDLLALTQSGVADIGYVQPAYVSEKMPLSAVVELPGIYTSSCAATAAYWRLAREGGLLAKEELAPNGVRPVFAVVLAPYQVLTAKRKLDTVKSFAGLKLRTAGGTQDSMARKLSAAPVRTSGPEMYEALSRGTVDGVVLPLASVLSYDLQGLLKHGTIGESFGTTVIAYMIGEARWKRLPETVRTAMTEAAERVSARACEYIDREVETAAAKLREAGVALEPLPEAGRRELRAVLASIATEWAEGLDRRGKAGTAVLKAYTAGAK